MQNQIPKNLPGRSRKAKEGWQKVKLGDVIEIIDGDRGSNYPKNHELLEAGYCLFLNTKNVSGTNLSLNEKQFITEENDNRLRKGKLKRGDFVLTTRGTVGNFGYYSNDITYDNIRINSGMVILRNDPDIVDTKFLQQYLASSDFKSQVISLSSGSAQPQLPIRDLKQFLIILPAISAQRQIASILSAFDDKIEVNNNIAKTLEQMAQGFFKEWFVNFRFPGHEKVEFVDSELAKIPKNWKVGKLGDVLQLMYGKGFKNEDRSNGNVPVIGSSGIIGYHDQSLVRGPGIVVGRKGNVGSILWIDDNFYPIDTTFYIQSEFGLHYCYFLLKRQKFITGDSAVPGLNRDMAYGNTVIIPDQKVVEEFEKIVTPIFNKLAKIKKENEKLEALRDLLLPKLMKGEILVSEK